jgi:hypothetical protein
MKKHLHVAAFALLLATASHLRSSAAPQDGGTSAVKPQTIAEMQTAAIASGSAETGALILPDTQAGPHIQIA